MKVGIVIPAYNEEKRIGETLKEYSYFFETLRKKDKKFDYLILISINNTHDKTKDIVKAYSRKNKRISFIDLVKGGKGYAIIEGFKRLVKKDYDLLGFVDADMATSPSAFYDLIKNIKGFDGIIASRYIKGAKVYPKQSVQRIIVSRIYNYFIRGIFLINTKDTQCGAKVFSSSSIKEILPKLTLSKWAFDLDLIYNSKKLGFKIREYPTIWSDKSYSKINFVKSGPIMVLALIRLRLLNSPFYSIMRIYDKLLNNILKLE